MPRWPCVHKLQIKIQKRKNLEKDSFSFLHSYIRLTALNSLTLILWEAKRKRLNNKKINEQYFKEYNQKSTSKIIAPKGINYCLSVKQ